MAPRRQRMTPIFNASQVCFLCGTIVPCYDEMTGKEKPQVVLEESDLKFYREKAPLVDHLFVPSTVVEGACFSKFPKLSSCFYRAGKFFFRVQDIDMILTSMTLVIQSCTTAEYYLTGIALNGCCGKNMLSYISRDKNSAQICSKRKRVSNFDNIRFRQYFPACIKYEQPSHYQGKDIGPLFHVHCWEILGYLIGKETIEKQPGRIVRAARNYWHRDGNLKFELTWEVEDIELFQTPDQLEKPHKRYFFGCDIYRSPWKVPEIQTAIKLARDRRTKTKKSLYLSKVFPLEIAFSVAEIVCPLDFTTNDVMSTRNMLFVFDINLPDSFWKSRLQSYHYLCFELDELKRSDSDLLDWQFLYLSFMHLVSDRDWFLSTGLGNRERVLKPIRGIIKEIHQLT